MADKKASGRGGGGGGGTRSLSSSSSSSSPATLPVFVFPSQITFSAKEDKKQLMTIYNPYDFSLEFSVLCTCPERDVPVVFLQDTAASGGGGTAAPDFSGFLSGPEEQAAGYPMAGLPLSPTSSSSRCNQSMPFLVSTAVSCLVALMLPCTASPSSASSSASGWLDPYVGSISLSVPQKLVAAYVLGLVTMSLFSNSSSNNSNQPPTPSPSSSSSSPSSR
ncbi:Motile sperm domain-containing protein 1 [Halotydeus destructor]|nr:Motile sperm domain-containing protein 1 [Halotydeus destructor]